MKIRKPLPQVVTKKGTVWTRQQNGWTTEASGWLAGAEICPISDRIVQGWIDTGVVTALSGWSDCEVCGQPYQRGGCKPDIAHPGHSYCAIGPTLVEGVRMGSGLTARKWTTFDDYVL